MLSGIEMVFGRSSGDTSTDEEAFSKTDISIFPMATPLIAGPAAMGAAILLMANEKGDLTAQMVVVASLLTILILTFIALRLANQIQKLLGVTGMNVI